MDTVDIIAWQGTTELLNAQWTLDSGRTVDLRLVETPFTVFHEHEFKKFQRRRGGRVGQRFHTVFVPADSEQPIYDGETMFAGWTDSDRGKTLKLWIDEDSAQHPFSGFKKRTAKEVGSLFASVFILITDDGNAIPVDTEQSKQNKKRKLSSDAHLIITSELFLQYLSEKCEYTDKLIAQHKVWTPDLAKRYVKHTLHIESLSDLDRDDEAADGFHATFRIPYLNWQGKDT